MAAATMFNLTFNFFISYFFLQMTQGIGKDGTFWMYAFFGVCAVIFFYFKVPETKNRSLEEIVRGESTDGQAA
jgi:SP family galactose:H+ symporter-like MFS transporter